MVKLPLGVDLNNLIDYLRIISWEASDILLHFSNKIKDLNYQKVKAGYKKYLSKISDDVLDLSKFNKKEFRILKYSSLDNFAFMLRELFFATNQVAMVFLIYQRL